LLELLEVFIVVILLISVVPFVISLVVAVFHTVVRLPDALACKIIDRRTSLTRTKKKATAQVQMSQA
jgi:uncharacterized membrane protein